MTPALAPYTPATYRMLRSDGTPILGDKGLVRPSDTALGGYQLVPDGIASGLTLGALIPVPYRGPLGNSVGRVTGVGRAYPMGLDIGHGPACEPVLIRRVYFERIKE